MRKQIIRMKNLIVCIALSIFSALKATAQKTAGFIFGENKKDVVMQPPIKDNTYLSRMTSVLNPVNTLALFTDGFNGLRTKYARLLNMQVEALNNISLLSFIDEWWNTRYRFGGTSKKGIDCSAFTGLLMNYVYAVKLPRTAKQQYAASKKVKKNDMLEGDMVFFNTRGGISHVGVYLGDGYFVHAGSSNGVTINNLEESYFNNRFIGARRAL